MNTHNVTLSVDIHNEKIPFHPTPVTFTPLWWPCLHKSCRQEKSDKSSNLPDRIMPQLTVQTSSIHYITSAVFVLAKQPRFHIALISLPTHIVYNQPPFLPYRKPPASAAFIITRLDGRNTLGEMQFTDDMKVCPLREMEESGISWRTLWNSEHASAALYLLSNWCGGKHVLNVV